jgi:hypothetical protein
VAKGMTLGDARLECARWFAYLKRQEDKALKMQEIATARRNGTIDEGEARRRVRSLDGAGVTVFDGANLEKAVRTLLACIDRIEAEKR